MCSSLQEEVKKLQGLVATCMSEQESLRSENARLTLLVQELEDKLQAVVQVGMKCRATPLSLHCPSWKCDVLFVFQQGETVSKHGEIIQMLQRQVIAVAWTVISASFYCLHIMRRAYLKRAHGLHTEQLPALTVAISVLDCLTIATTPTSP